jgi:uncharacterized protein (TIGR00369 family)
MSDAFLRERDHLQGLHWQCFGCGMENRLGLRLNIRLVGDRTECEFTPIAEFQGPPGIAHSGVVAAVLDEVMSQLIYAQLQLAVTRKIEVTYRRPLRVGQTYRFTAEIVKQNSRIIAARAEARDVEGNQVARARGIFAPLDEERAAKFLDKESSPQA